MSLAPSAIEINISMTATNDTSDVMKISIPQKVSIFVLNPIPLKLLFPKLTLNKPGLIF